MTNTHKAVRKIVIITLIMVLAVIPLWMAKVSFAENTVLKVVPGSGLPKSAITLYGHNFKANEKIDVVLKLEEGVLVGLGTRKVNVIIADEKGSFIVKTAIPKIAKQGAYTIYAAGSMGSKATTSLTVTKNNKGN